MPALDRYPYLARVHEELTRLAAEHGPEPSGSGRLQVSPGRDINRVSWPGLGAYWLTGPQLAVVRELLDALLHSRSPDVDQSHLMRRARAAGATESRLRDVFLACPAWGELVVEGSSPGSYRLFAPPVAGPEEGPPDDDWAA